MWLTHNRARRWNGRWNPAWDVGQGAGSGIGSDHKSEFESESKAVAIAGFESGEPIESLFQELHDGNTLPEELPALMASAYREQYWVVLSNRRLKQSLGSVSIEVREKNSG